MVTTIQQTRQTEAHPGSGVSPETAVPGLPQQKQSEYETLYKRSSHFLGGTVCLFLLGFLSFPILARIFTVEQYGLIALVSNTVAVAVVFSKCGLQTSVQRFYKENAVSSVQGKLGRYYSTVYLSAGILGLIVTLLLVGGIHLLPSRLIGPQVQMVFGYAAALIFLRSISSMIVNLLQVEGRTTAYNALQISTKAATVAVTILLLLSWKRTPSVFFVGTVLIEACAVLAMMPYLRRRGMLTLNSFDWKVCREALAFGFPMMGTEIFWLVLDSGDRFLVAGYLGVHQLGFYAAAYNIAGYIRDSLSSPLSLALFPLVMELWVLKGRENTQQFLGRSLNYFILVGIGVVAAVIVCSGDAINLVASAKFHEAHRLLPFLAAGMLFHAIAMFFKSGLLIYKKTMLMMKVNLAACVANIALNVVLLPRIGILGAAIATLASYAFMTSLFAWFAQAHMPLALDWWAWLKYVVIAAITWSLVSHIEISHVFLSLLVRGGLTMFLYYGSLYVIDARARELLSLAVHAAMSRLSPRTVAPGGASA